MFAAIARFAAALSLSISISFFCSRSLCNRSRIAGCLKNADNVAESFAGEAVTAATVATVGLEDMSGTGIDEIGGGGGEVGMFNAFSDGFVDLAGGVKGCCIV